MTCRTYMGEVLNQVWLKSSRNEGVIGESLKNISRAHATSCKPMKKVCDENETKKQKNDIHIKMLLMEGGHL